MRRTLVKVGIIAYPHIHGDDEPGWSLLEAG